jgi:hypothetical protein
MNGPNKLDCYITLGFKGLPGINTQAFWVYSLVTIKMKGSEYDSLWIS